jgi:hypothetical protein
MGNSLQRHLAIVKNAVALDELEARADESAIIFEFKATARQ